MQMRLNRLRFWRVHLEYVLTFTIGRWEFENSELTRDQIRNYMLAEVAKVAQRLAQARPPAT